jgi:hypothetical protein
MPPGVVRLLGVVVSPPGLVSAGLLGMLDDPPMLDGMLGTTTPNCERLDCSADMISPGRSVIIAAWTKSWCSGTGLSVSPAVTSITAVSANGLATASAATALMAVDRLRRRLFGTEISSNVGN